MWRTSQEQFINVPVKKCEKNEKKTKCMSSFVCVVLGRIVASPFLDSVYAVGYRKGVLAGGKVERVSFVFHLKKSYKFYVLLL